jgi:ectoine hydroxylase-related dioxygenase (phytanoyl-CoA dioxygenase family)
MSTHADHIAECLERMGCCIVDLGCEDKLEQVQSLYSEYYGEAKRQGMGVTHNNGDWMANLAAGERLIALFKDELDRLFPNYTPFIAHFVSKSAHTYEGFQLHRDWSIVDEREQRSIQLWIPLELSYPENGGMLVMPGTHKGPPLFRSGSFDIPRIQLSPETEPFVAPVRLFPAQAVAFSNSLFHGSCSNPTPYERLAVLVNLVPLGAGTVYADRGSNGRPELKPVSVAALLSQLPELEKGEPLRAQAFESVDEGHAVPVCTGYGSDELIATIRERRSTDGMPLSYLPRQVSILNDAELEREVNVNGFAVTNLLDSGQVQQLKGLFHKYFRDRSVFFGRYNTIDNVPTLDRCSAHEEIVSCVKESLAAMFHDFTVPISCLYSKRPDGVSDTDWHSDPDYVLNQSLMPMYGIWCPLVRCDDHNGVLNVIPRSHRVINSLIHKWQEWPLAPYRRQLDRYSVSFDLRPGQAIIFDARLIHRSLANLSDEDRDCIVMRVAHQDAEFFSVSPEPGPDRARTLFRESERVFLGRANAGKGGVSDTGVPVGRFYHFEPEINLAAVHATLSSVLSQKE